MMSAPADPIPNFLTQYHLWSLVLFLSLLGLRDMASLAVWSWYRFRTEIDDSSYSYKAHHLENERDYQQRAGR
jgi:hypothetical protein